MPRHCSYETVRLPAPRISQIKTSHGGRGFRSAGATDSRGSPVQKRPRILTDRRCCVATASARSRELRTAIRTKSPVAPMAAFLGRIPSPTGRRLGLCALPPSDRSGGPHSKVVKRKQSPSRSLCHFFELLEDVIRQIIEAGFSSEFADRAVGQIGAENRFRPAMFCEADRLPPRRSFP
jgi:hypothetical protein